MKHASHPNGGSPHPFKAATLCGFMVRFGQFAYDDEKVDCKKCLKVLEKLCPTCQGTGVKLVPSEPAKEGR